MTKAIRIHKTGGHEVLAWEDIEVPAPGPGEALVRQTAVGLNFIDTYQRSGLYPVKLPAIMGNEGAGVVEAVGAGVTEVKTGYRVAYHSAAGAYAEQRIVPAWLLAKLPDGISDQQGASMMLKGAPRNTCCARPTRSKRATRLSSMPRPAASGSSPVSGPNTSALR